MGARATRPRRGWLAGVAAIVAATALGLAGCQPESGEGPREVAGERGDSAPSTDPTPTAPQAEITVRPADGAQDVAPDTPVTVEVAHGTLSEVAVAPADDSDEAGIDPAAAGDPTGDDAVTGTLNDDKTTWTADGGLLQDTAYQVTASAVDAHGRTTEVTQRFRTLQADTILGTEITPDGTTVGVGHPLVVKFSTDVADEAKADVERALVVESSNPVEGAWHWFTDDTIHYRPKEYWPAHTDVTVRLDLRGVSGGEGVWGIRDKVKEFSIGRSIITKVDLTRHQQQVFIDGELARTIPITAGQPGWETRSGVKVVLERRRDITLRSESIGIANENSDHYYNMFAPYALRVTWSGEFHHTADWSIWAHGNSNVSHGCVGMGVEDSRWMWENSQVGDVVEVTGSDKPMDVFGNGYGDWNLSWEQWLEGSALAGEDAETEAGS